MFVNYGSPVQYGGGVSSQALGEEGGNNNGGSVTTLAIGEEGGGGVTTLAFGEEGGGQMPPANQRFAVNDVLRIFDGADRTGRPGPTDAPMADGHLTQQEIRTRLAELESIVNIQFDPQREKDIQTLRFLDQNFNAIAGPDLHQESVFGPQQPAPVRSITKQEIQQVAARDGIANELSSADLRSNPNPYPPNPGPYPQQPPFNNFLRLMQQMMQLFMSFFGRQ